MTTDTQTHQRRDPGIYLLGIYLISLVCFIALQFTIPRHFSSLWGLNSLGTEQFAAMLHAPRRLYVSGSLYQILFRSLLTVSCLFYLLLIRQQLIAGRLGIRPLAAASAAAGLVFAILCPPSLSADSYSYVASARLQVRYHQNTYLALPQTLEDHGDEVARYLPHRPPPAPAHTMAYNFPALYAPLWSAVTCALVFFLQSAGLWGQIVAIKLLEGLAVLGSAFAGRKIAERQYPGYGNISFLALGLNPFFLIEGPGNGHNDFLMISFFLWGIVFLGEKRLKAAGALIGASIAIKFVTLAAVPWIALEMARIDGLSRKRIVRFALYCLLPTAIFYLPFWDGMATFNALKLHAHFGLNSWIDSHPSLVVLQMQRHHAPKALIGLVRGVINNLPGLSIYAALTVWLLQREKSDWLPAWIIIALLQVHLTLGFLFPWYVAWALAPCLTQWSRLYRQLSAAVFSLAYLFTLFYTVGLQNHAVAVFLFCVEIAGRPIIAFTACAFIAVIGKNYFRQLQMLRKASP